MSFADGYTPLPRGKVASIVTYLRMTSPPERPEPRPDAALVRLMPGDQARYRRLFRAVGEEWLWFGRLSLNDNELGQLLGHPAVACHALVRGGEDIGILDIDYRGGLEAELEYVGLVPSAIGSGLGRWLITTGSAMAFERGAERVMVHTCNLDHPAALAAYQRAGFKPYARAIEVADDPRLDGRLPREAAPHHPVIVREN